MVSTTNRTELKEGISNLKRHKQVHPSKSAGLAGVSSGMGLDDGLLVYTLLLLI